MGEGEADEQGLVDCVKVATLLAEGEPVTLREPLEQPLLEPHFELIGDTLADPLEVFTPLPQALKVLLRLGEGDAEVEPLAVR